MGGEKKNEFSVVVDGVRPETLGRLLGENSTAEDLALIFEGIGQVISEDPEKEESIGRVLLDFPSSEGERFLSAMTVVLQRLREEATK